MAFYHSGSRGEKARAVRENLKAFNVRPDLKKLSEVEDEASVPVAELPRYFMSRDQGHFDQLMSLIDDGTTGVAEEAWELLQMLAKSLKQWYLRHVSSRLLSYLHSSVRKQYQRLMETAQSAEAPA